MELQPLSVGEMREIIARVNIFADTMDQKILAVQERYQNVKASVTRRHAQELKRFDDDYTRRRSNLEQQARSLLTDADQIRQDLYAMDQHLSGVDKYYVKTKNKKEAELAGIRSQKYGQSHDYFLLLNSIKQDYRQISQKYSEDILPGLLNGLNYLFSQKRKKDYEDLIVLRNTIDGFCREIRQVIPELTAEQMIDLEDTSADARREMLRNQKNELQGLENEYNGALERLSVEIDQGLEKDLPRKTVKRLEECMEHYRQNYTKVNNTAAAPGGMLYAAEMAFPIGEFIASKALASMITAQCGGLVRDGVIRFPFLVTESNPQTLYFEAAQNSAMLRQLVQGVMYSYLSSVPVSNVRLSVIDFENHGNSPDRFFDCKKKAPQLFDGKFYTNPDEINAKLSRLSETVEEIIQEKLGTRYRNIQEYRRDYPEEACETELLTIFDFPKGIDEHGLSLLRNIVEHGGRCGIHVCICQGSPIVADLYSRELLAAIGRIQSASVMITYQNGSFTSGGLPFIGPAIPGQAELGAFFSKYLLIMESIRNKGIAFPAMLRELTNAKDNDTLKKAIRTVKGQMDESGQRFGHVPGEAASFPEQITIGATHYPVDVFSDCTGFREIQSSFADSTGRIRLPLALNLHQTEHIMLQHTGSRSAEAARFVHSVMWSFLSEMNPTKLKFTVFDCNRKGSSITPFLDLRKKCPDVFGDAIVTDSDMAYERLRQLNQHINHTLQEKLGYQFNDLVEYNVRTPRRTESITVVPIFDFPSGFEDRSLGLLRDLLRNGARCGVYVLLCYNQDVNYSSYDPIENRVEELKQFCSVLEYRNGSYQLLPFNLPVSLPAPLSESRILDFAPQYQERCKEISGKGLPFSDILDSSLFSRNLDNGLSIPIGIGDADSVVPITFGRGSSHHALVAGATGSGKTTLLHTLITSAMLHYTPERLNLYLLDFKSGTEFKRYDDYRLPHIKLLALDAMQEFGESILENLDKEIAERSKEFKRYSVEKLRDYVRKSGKSMPNILVIMDEFQVLFNDSTNRKVANHCAELTKRVVSEGRSYGVHLLMATQSTKIIGDLTLASGTVEQMRIRIGLKCSDSDTNYLFTDRNDQQAKEMMKGPIGTAVLNEEYTEQDNIGLRAVYCDKASEVKYLTLIQETFADRPCDTRVFEGSRTKSLLEVLPSQAAAYPAAVHVGELIKVADPMKVVFDRRMKHNTLICGANTQMAENICNLYTLAALLSPQSTVYCIDGEWLLGEDPSARFYGQYDRFGDKFVRAPERGQIIAQINKIYEHYQEQKRHSTGEQVFVLVKNLQFVDILKSMLKAETIDESEYLTTEDPFEAEPAVEAVSDDDMDFSFDFGADDNLGMGVSEKLLKLIDDGSGYGIHFIFSCTEFQTIKECMYYGENTLPKFKERFVFSLSDNDCDSLIEGISVTSLADNTVYYTDSVKSTFQVKPYLFPTAEELAAYLDGVI